jgi:hypothetical protein
MDHARETMKQTNRPIRVLVVFGVVAAAVGAGGWAGATALRSDVSANVCTAWKVVRSPYLRNANLFRVSASSSTDVWAVGDDGGAYPIIYHWNGTRWTADSQKQIAGVLYGISAITPSDAWAVGYLNHGGYPLTLTEHWDGTTWSVVPSPSPDQSDVLSDSVAVATNDVWAAGNYLPHASTTIQPLFLHWDGTKWQHVPEATGLVHGGIVSRIAAVSTGDVWAVGYQGTPTPFSTDALTEHWDGSIWSVVPAAPPPVMESSTLNGVAAISAHDVWAVAWGGAGSPYIEHWDGSAWSVVPSPTVTGVLFGVGAASTDDVWAVGDYGSNLAMDLTEHWDGSMWTQISTPAPGQQSALAAVTAISSTDLWAVGDYVDPSTGNSTPLALHSKGPCPQPEDRR